MHASRARPTAPRFLCRDAPLDTPSRLCVPFVQNVSACQWARFVRDPAEWTKRSRSRLHGPHPRHTRLTLVHLTTRQIARVLGRDESVARRRIASWRSTGTPVGQASTDGRPSLTVAIEAVAAALGSSVEDVRLLAGV